MLTSLLLSTKVKYHWKNFSTSVLIKPPNWAVMGGSPSWGEGCSSGHWPALWSPTLWLATYSGLPRKRGGVPLGRVQSAPPPYLSTSWSNLPFSCNFLDHFCFFLNTTSIHHEYFCTKPWSWDPPNPAPTSNRLWMYFGITGWVNWEIGVMDITFYQMYFWFVTPLFIHVQFNIYHDAVINKLLNWLRMKVVTGFKSIHCDR